MKRRLAAAEEAAARAATPKELARAPELAQTMLEGLLENLSIAGADATEGRARKILGGLGFSACMQDGPPLASFRRVHVPPRHVWWAAISCPAVQL